MNKRLVVEKRREELKDLIARKGISGINKSELGKKYGVSNVMIGKDINAIINEIPDEKIKAILNRLHVQFLHALNTAERLLESENERIQLKAVSVIMNTIERFTKFTKNYSKQKEFNEYENENILY
jgi:hypothetical protein